MERASTRIHDSEPLRLALANVPTHGHALRIGDDLGVPIWMKRDDQTGSELAGNKVRKLEYLMAEAVQQDATCVLTCGGEQSNHARATAFAAAKLGLRCVLILRCDDPVHPPATSANILLDRLAGAEIRWITRAAWRDRNALLAAAADEVRAGGGQPYVIPEGGSNAIGSWGYVRAAHELAADVADLPKPLTVVYACGSGGTGAGLVLGGKLFGLAAKGIRFVGVPVCDDAAYFVDAISRICNDAEERWQLRALVTAADIQLLDGYVGAGYAKSRPEELDTIALLARRDGVVVDPVYTGKAFHAVATELRRDRERFGTCVVFVHTGGMYGAFASAELAERAERP